MTTKNSTLTLNVKRLGINGEGIAYFKRRAVFIRGALPKEKVLVQITKKERNYWEGKLIKILKKSPDRIEPRCPVYEQCGGCQLQHLKYEAQCHYKEELIKQSFAKFKPRNYENYHFLPSIDMENPWFYRNKLQFQARKQNGKAKFGLYALNSHQLIPIDNCYVQEPTTQKIVNTIQTLADKYQFSLYNERKNIGWLKTIMVRIGIKTNEVQVVLITKNRDFKNKKPFIEELIKLHPNIVSIMQNINNKKTSEIMGDKTLKLYGKNKIEEKLDQVIFDLSAKAFFQLNPIQTEKLYNAAITAIEPNKDDVIIDAYCGVGTIGLSIAPQVKKVLGMDTIKEAIIDANYNAKRLNYQNTSYLVGDASKVLPQWLQTEKPTGIIVDPPRTGLGQELSNELIKAKIPKLVYISCNPSTLAKDLVTLTKQYDVISVQSVDMFPQTARVEAIVSLRLRT